MIDTKEEQEQMVEWDTQFTPEQKDALRTIRDSLLYAMQNVSEGKNNEANADLSFAYSKIRELLNRS